MAAMIENTSVNTEVCAAAANDPTLLATDLADLPRAEGNAVPPGAPRGGAVVSLAEKRARP